MDELVIEISARAQSSAVAEIVERACTDEGLSPTMKGTLAGYPGCVHWHYKKGKERGTLEITWWGQENRLWFKVSAGRTGDWVENVMTRLKEQVEHALVARGKSSFGGLV